MGDEPSTEIVAPRSRASRSAGSVVSRPMPRPRTSASAADVPDAGRLTAVEDRRDGDGPTREPANVVVERAGVAEPEWLVARRQARRSTASNGNDSTQISQPGLEVGRVGHFAHLEAPDGRGLVVHGGDVESHPRRVADLAHSGGREP